MTVFSSFGIMYMYLIVPVLLTGEPDEWFIYLPLHSSCSLPDAPTDTRDLCSLVNYL
jgi:hypothetical protein